MHASGCNTSTSVLVIETTVSVRLAARDDEELHLTVDWASYGQGFSLRLDEPHSGRSLSLGSKKTVDAVSSMLGEMRAVCWGFERDHEAQNGTIWTIWTDSQATVSGIRRQLARRERADAYKKSEETVLSRCKDYSMVRPVT